MAKPSALGKGLSALISTRPATPIASPAPAVEKGERVQQLAPSLLAPSPLQPRKVFKEDELQELADSIREHGILQPLICRKSGELFELIAGERRWRASQLAGLETLPVIVREASDRDVLELALIENLQRAELNPLEEAKAYLRLAEEFSMKQEDISRSVGRSRASVANSIRLLDLAPDLQTWLSQDRISVGHAKVLLGLRSHEEQIAAAEEILRKGLTVRGTETLVAQIAEAKGKEKRTKPQTSAKRLAPAVQRLQNRLQHHFGTHVALQHGEKRGRIEIEYYGQDDLDRILSLLGIESDDR
jgi:ParB family chromosome partitioning protein